jgi:hypothetical protein
MSIYEVELTGAAREIYQVEAASAAEAARHWDEVGPPVLVELSSMEIVEVRQVEP